MTIDLTDGVCVVTGAGRGLGRAMAIELCSRGVQVVGLGRNVADLRAVSPVAGPGFHAVTCDVSDTAQVAAAFSNIATIGPVSILINNAAVYPRRDFLEEDTDSFMRSVAVNLGGTVACTRHALEVMVDRGFGRILNVATFADIAPLPASSAYAVSKGAARIFTRALVADLGDRFPDIVIGDWMPGMLATTMGIPDGLDPAQSAKWGATLALWHDPSLTGTVFEMDRELPPQRSLKRRLLDKALLRKQVIRSLG